MPVLTPADLKGMKIRLWEDKTAIETWRGLGGNPVVIPRPQIYLALKQGLIEAGPETIGIAYDQKDDEVAKYWTRTGRVFPDRQHHDEPAPLQSLDRRTAEGAARRYAGRRRGIHHRIRARLHRKDASWRASSSR